MSRKSIKLVFVFDTIQHADFFQELLAVFDDDRLTEFQYFANWEVRLK